MSFGPQASAAPTAPPAAAQAPAPVPAAEPLRPAPLVGGFAPVDLRAAELRPVVKAAVAHLTPAPRARDRARLLSAERQVVAGANYRLLVQLRDGSRWRVTVWQKPDGTRQVTEAQRTPS